ncbi:MAG: sigma-70 family RNA polymerase sigma factor [Acidimicrobiales bacterium]
MADSAPRAARQEDDEIAALWRKFKRDGDRTARERLVHLYYPLVKHVARNLAPTFFRHAAVDDLEGYGAVGLIDAIDRYDPNRGVQFSTFAVHRIRGAVYDGIRAADWVPRSVRRKAREMHQTHTELYAQHGRPPTEQEEAAALDVSVATLRTGKMQVAAAGISSLDGLTSDDGFGAEPAASDDTDPLGAYLAREKRQAVRVAVAKLSERERTVAVMSFGQGMTLAEIGRTLGVTESRVCQIRSSALAHLRGYMHAAGMGPEGSEERQLAGASATV